MAEKASRLAEILKQEYKSNGAVGGLASAAGKRIREKLDVRNVLFGGTGVGALIGRKIFGKGYSAIGDKSQNDLSAKTAPLLAEQTSKLDIISVNSQITAKNSMALPSMARDMNLMKLNIFKLVKLQGGIANTNKTDIFWQKSKLREAEYEKQFNKSNSSPSRMDGGKTPQSSGGIAGMFSGTIGSIIETLWKFKGEIVGVLAIGGSIWGLAKLLGKAFDWLRDSSLGKMLGLSTMDATGRKNAANDPRTIANQSSTTGDRSFKNPFDVNWSNVGSKAGDVVSNVGGVALDAVGLRAGVKMLPSDKFKMVGGTLAEKTAEGKAGKLKSAKQIAGNGKLGDILEKLRKFAVESGKKGWGPRITQKLTAKLGGAIAAKCATMFASLAAAPFSAGISLLITIVSAAWLIKDIYDIYDAICGPGGIWDELTEEDKGKTSPSPVNNTNAPSISPSNVTSTSGITMEQIGNAEGGKMGYDAANKGKAGDMPNGMPGLSSKKVGEVMKLQSEKQLFAAGKYQIIPDTLNGLVREGVISMNDTFDKATQDKAFKALFDRRIRIAGADPIRQQFELSKEFASVANPYTGQSYYAGVGNNKASIMGASSSAGSALASNSQSMESIVRQMMAGGTTVNNITNNNNGGTNQQQAPVTIAAADVMDTDFGKLLARMY